jgi:hypothetical protein
MPPLHHPGRVWRADRSRAFPRRLTKDFPFHVKARHRPLQDGIDQLDFAANGAIWPSTLACPNAVNAATGAGQNVLGSLDDDALAKNGEEDFHFRFA